MSESNVDLEGLQQQVAEKKRLEAKLRSCTPSRRRWKPRHRRWNRPS